jgi:hypothetical protein
LDAYVEAHEEPKSINCLEFRAAFRAHHVPQGVIKLKRKEFQGLKQGSMFVNEYVTRFAKRMLRTMGRPIRIERVIQEF